MIISTGIENKTKFIDIMFITNYLNYHATYFVCCSLDSLISVNIDLASCLLTILLQWVVTVLL